MRATHAIHFSLRSAALAVPLALAACGAAAAQDVVYVDDLMSGAAAPTPKNLPHLSRGASAPPAPTATASRRTAPSEAPATVGMHRRPQVGQQPGLTHRQAAQAVAARAEAAQRQKEQSLLGRLGDALKFQNPFSRDESGDASAASTQANARMGAAHSAAGGVAPTSHTAPRGGLNTRSGDRRAGLFSFGRTPSEHEDESPAPNPRTAGRSTRQAFAQRSSTTRKPSAASARGTLLSGLTEAPARRPATRVERPLAKPTRPSEPVFVTDMGPDTPPASTPNAPNKPMATTKNDPAIAMVSDEQPTAPTEPAQRLTATTGAAPKPIVRAVAPAPLIVENSTGPALAKPNKPKKTEIELLEETPPGQPTRVAGKTPAKAMPAPADDDAETLVLPNPVEAAKPQPKASPRAAELLAEAHQLAGEARTEEEFTRVVQQCRHVLAIDDAPVAVEYANRLAAWALNKRGECKADDGRTQEAMADFDDAVRTDREHWRAVHNRGVLLAQSGDFSEAFQAFNDTIELNPKFGKAYSNRASLYVQAGEFQTALDDYKKAIKLNPDLVVAHKGRGRVCHVLGQLEQALRHFDAATLLAPGDAYIATCRADLLVDLGRYAEARNGYRHAMELDPSLAIAYRNLAWMQATCPQGAYRDALQALANAQKALELSGAEDDICLDTLAAAQAASGDYAAATETIKRAIALAPSSDQQEYNERLELYEASKPYRSEPMGVRHAGFQQVSDQDESTSES